MWRNRFTLHKKAALCCAALFLSVFLTACGGKADTSGLPEIDASIAEGSEEALLVGSGASETVSDHSESDISDSPEIPISWGYFFDGAAIQVDSQGRILQWLNERYQVALTGECLSCSPLYDELLKAGYAAGNLPDVLAAVPMHRFYDAGWTRSIPLDTVARHAPRFYERLTGDSMSLATAVLPTDRDKLVGLPVYQFPDALPEFSVYRLDWLEQIGMQPKGATVEIEKRILYTDEAFTEAEMRGILRAFTYNNPNDNPLYDTHGLTVNASIFDASSPISNLMGMYGLHPEEAFYADDAYRDFLLFLSELYADGSLHFDENNQVNPYINEAATSGRTGWWNDSSVGLYVTRGLLLNNSRARVLVTNPEIGETGKQGCPGPANGFAQRGDGGLLINSRVSDEKLARILEIFDDVSFDEEAFVVSRYGMEGSDFRWIGEPYDSGLEFINSRERTMREGAGLTETYQFDYPAMLFLSNYPELYKLAAQPKTAALVYRPVVHIGGETGGELDETTRAALATVVDAFYRAAVTGTADIYGEWDAYVEALYASGFHE